MFQSTHPHGVRPCQTPHLSHPKWGFNPRTHTGCDIHFFLVITYIYGFNPRTHTGCDGAYTSPYLGDYGFQSTHPHGVRRTPSRHGSPRRSFNPRTHTGCDFIVYLQKIFFMSFNPRTHTGCDYKLAELTGLAPGFNPRTHTGCDTNSPSN